MQIPSRSRTQDASRVAQLEKACRVERRRALAGHWTYSLPYHLELLRQLKTAREELQSEPMGRELPDRPHPSGEFHQGLGVTGTLPLQAAREEAW